MDDRRLNELVKKITDDAIKSAFNGKTEKISKTRPLPPNTPEREYQRLLNEYMGEVKDVLKIHMGRVITSYGDELRKKGIDENQTLFKQLMDSEMSKIAKDIEKKTGGKIDLNGRMSEIGEMAKKRAVKEWRKIVKDTIGINILEDYYLGDFFRENLSAWVLDNVSYIKSIPTDMLNRMSRVMQDGYYRGLTIDSMQKKIQQEFNVSKSKARFLARDQMGTLNSQITKAQQVDAGVTRYKWSTCLDQRVRECHKELNGKIFSWYDPPEMWYPTKEGRKTEGRRCHPGEDYCCRCVAIPVFDEDTLDLPIDVDAGIQK